jgi:hypothetical protein
MVPCAMRDLRTPRVLGLAASTARADPNREEHRAKPPPAHGRSLSLVVPA